MTPDKTYSQHGSEAYLVGATTRVDQIRGKYVRIKSKVHMWFYAAFWRTLHFLGIGWTYSRFACRMNWYRKFADGRCHWCGRIH